MEWNGMKQREIHSVLTRGNYGAYELDIDLGRLPLTMP